MAGLKNDERLNGNELIAEAIRDFHNTQSEETALHITLAILSQIEDDGCMIAPMQFHDNDGKPVKLDALTEEELEALQENDNLNVSVQAVSDEQTMTDWLPMFTSYESYHKGDMTTVMVHPIAELMAIALDIGLAGVVIDPWDDYALNIPAESVASIMELATESADEGDLTLIQGDITKMDVECIVNAANNTLLGGSGVDGAIHRAAGPELLEECRTLHGCKTGGAKLTKGYNLPADYVIHTVGPIYSGTLKDESQLFDCYWNSLDLAAENDIHTIAFPAISTGVFGYPKEEACSVAIDAVLEWMSMNDDYGMKVTFCVHNNEDYATYRKHLDEILGEPDSER
jgi:O-acetyl-ADP-ribose deacetylase (regulator of RNase III)